MIPSLKIKRVTRPRSSIAYEYAKKAIQTPSTYEFKDAPTFTGKDKTEKIYINTHGILLDCRLNNKWRLKTGLRFSNSDIYTVMPIETIYDSEKEYFTNDGKLANDLSLEQTSPSLKSSQEVQLLFNDDNKLEEGEEFKLLIENYQEQKYFQLPLGLEYKVASNKLDWSAGLGFSWNKILFGDSYQEISFYQKEAKKEIGIKSMITENTKIQTLDFLSTYATIGASYRFSDNWSIYTGFIYNYNLVSKATEELESWSKNDQAIMLGLKYNFLKR